MPEDKNTSLVDEDALEQHVEEIMDSKTPDPEQGSDIDIFAGQTKPTSAPEVQGAKIPKEPAPKIDKLLEPIEETPNEETGEPGEENVVDDIVAKESDDLLEAEDKELTKAFANEKPSFKQKLKDFFAAWWQNKKLRWATIIGAVVIVAAVAIFPTSRYFVLNTVGVRASASMAIYDDSTTQPLKNVQVRLAGQTAQTDSEGKVRLEHLKLGTNELVIEKRAFAEVKRTVTVGWGSNPLGEVSLHPVGSQYVLHVTDFLSGKNVDKAEASSGDANAISNAKGIMKLTVDATTDDADLKVIIKAEGYRDEEVTIPAGSKSQQAVKLVLARKEVFVSKRSGKYDLYSVDIDGKNEKLVLVGSGSEREDITLLSHPTEELAAFVSTRDNKHNSDGYLLSSLLVVDLKDNSSEKVVESERVRVLGWNGDRLIFIKVVAGGSAADPKRERLISYNYKTAQSQELAATNYFNDATLAGGKIYYAPSSAYQNGTGVGFLSINSDGTSKQTILSSEAWNLFRTAHDKITISSPGGWYDYKIGDKQAIKLSGQPAAVNSRVYTDSQDGKHSLWVDIRDGKGVLISYDTASSEDKVLLAKSGIKNPVRWLNNSSLVFRVNTDQESADYAMNIDGGQMVKIRDVTNTAGVNTNY